MPRFEVQHFTLCGGWVNTWSYLYEDGREEPTTYETRAEAEAAVDEFIAESDGTWDYRDYRVVEVK